jgi:hypothetical protein
MRLSIKCPVEKQNKIPLKISHLRNSGFSAEKFPVKKVIASHKVSDYTPL